MTKAAALNLGLLAAVAALAALAYLKPARETPAEYALSTQKPAEVAAVRIERRDAPAIALEKSGEAWLITAPFRARADGFAVTRLLTVLEARSRERLPAAELGRFDLDPPAVRLTLGGQSFGFGSINPLTREQYVATQDAVYMVPPRHGAAVPAQAAALASRQLFGPGEAPVALRFREFALTKGGGKWVLAPPGAEASQDDFNRWVDEWRLATALSVQPYARQPPAGEIAVDLNDGRKLALAILAREPGLVLLRCDENLQYHFAPETGKRLLAPPAGTPGKR